MNNLINVLVKNNLSPELYFILYCIINNIDYPWKNDLTYTEQLKYLEDNNFITIKDDSCIIRGKAELIFEVKKTEVEPINIIDWVQEYVDLWPKGIKSGGRPVKPNSIAVTNKLNKFINKYKVSKQQILDATKNYINEMESKGYKMMTCGDYFISKFDNSLLATYIDNLGEIEEQGSYFKMV